MYEDITEAANAVDEAQRALRRLVVHHAGRDGRNMRAIAAAADITPQTAYRWVAEAGPGRSAYGNTPGPAMADALVVLLELGAGPIGTLTGGLRTTDLRAKARRVQLGVGNLAGSMDAIGATDEQQAILNAGLQAAQDVLGDER